METTITLGVLTAIVIGVTQVAKEAGMPSRYAPLLALGLGILGVLSITLFQPTANAVLSGIVVGLSAMGLYSGTKALQGN